GRRQDSGRDFGKQRDGSGASCGIRESQENVFVLVVFLKGSKILRKLQGEAIGGAPIVGDLPEKRGRVGPVDAGPRFKAIGQFCLPLLHARGEHESPRLRSGRVVVLTGAYLVQMVDRLGIVTGGVRLLGSIPIESGCARLRSSAARTRG